MKQICEMYQIENLNKQGVIGDELTEHLKEQFLHLLESIDEGIAVYDFDITAYGNIVIFEKNDNLFDLSYIGFENRAITSLFPEYVEVKTYDNKEYYEGIVVCNNEYAFTFIAPKGVYAEEIEQWFQAEAAQE